MGDVGTLNELGMTLDELDAAGYAWEFSLWGYNLMLEGPVGNWKRIEHKHFDRPHTNEAAFKAVYDAAVKHYVMSRLEK